MWRWIWFDEKESSRRGEIVKFSLLLLLCIWNTQHFEAISPLIRRSWCRWKHEFQLFGAFLSSLSSFHAIFSDNWQIIHIFHSDGMSSASIVIHFICKIIVLVCLFHFIWASDTIYVVSNARILASIRKSINIGAKAMRRSRDDFDTLNTRMLLAKRHAKAKAVTTSLCSLLSV